ncbi:MAG TPA: nucleotidyltransferase family protein [Polyangia bacterium]|nr:nucleotidyltransferase family protein [Polyangia bacterium]
MSDPVRPAPAPAPAPPSTAAVVLAAGSSTRMGSNKLLLAVDGQPLVARAVRAAAAAGLAPIVVVLGHEAERVRAVLDGLPCRAVVNPDHARGKGTSLQLGIAEVARATDAAAAVVMLADMPFVSAEMLAAVARAAQRDGGTARAPMVISRYGEVNAPPILYDRATFAELAALPAQACGKEMVRRHRGEAVFLDWPPAALADVDVPEDYQRVLDGIGVGAGGGET